MSKTVRSDRLPELPSEDTRVMNAPQSPTAGAYPFLRPPSAPGEMGRLGGYRVIRLLGSGGMGKVFLAEDLTLHRQVALKVMCLPEGEDHQSGWERFLREARALAAINHPNLVTVYQTGQDQGTIFLAMELLEGETLERCIRREAPLDVPDIVRIAEQIATGLQAIHDRGLIHRDIKPSNIWLLSVATQDTEPLEESEESPSPKAQVKILDFGLVREVEADTQLTEAGVVVGTPAYMSPEQVRGHALDQRTDLFSFGCVLYAMATGRAPFEATNPMAQAAALAADEPVRARKLNASIPKPLSNLIAALLAKNPDERPASAAEVIERLRTLDDDSEKETPKSRRSFLQRHGIKLVAAVWVVAVALGVFAVAYVPPRHGGGDSGDQPPPAPAVEYLSAMTKVEERPFPPPGSPMPPGFDGVVRVGGTTSPHGIFMHGAPGFQPPTFASYSLGKKYSRFTADVAMNDSAGKWSNLTFVVSGDGKELWKSSSLRAGDPAERCDVDVRDVKTLTLEVRTAGTERGAHGAWVEPRLTK